MKSILSILLLVCLSIPALAADWVGANGANWNVAANWNPANIPGTSDNVTITNGKLANIPGNYAAAAKSVIMTGSGSLTVAATGSLAVNGSTANAIFLGTNLSTLVNSGTINIGNTAAVFNYAIVLNNAGATLNNMGTISINSGKGGIVQFSGTSTNSGTITINNTTQYVGLQVSAGTCTNTGTIKIGNTGPNKAYCIFINGGTITNSATLELNNVLNTSTDYEAFGAAAGTFNNTSTGILSIGTSSIVKNGIGSTQTGTSTTAFNNAGTINFGSQIALDAIESISTVNNNTSGIINTSASGLLKIAGKLNNTGTVNNSATGTLTVNGTFTNNAAGTVTNNGILAGTGTITQNGTITNAAGSHIAPGNSPGTLTITGDFDLGNATLDAEVNGNTTALYDRLAISGAATLTNASLNVVLDPGYTASNSDVLSIINAGSLVGTFSSTQTAGLSKRYNYPAAGQFSVGTPVALPVKLLSFTAVKEGTRNRIDWATAKEDAGTNFEITRSSNGNSFDKIGTTEGKGHDAAYTFYDEQPIDGVNYYRLKRTDASGESTYSNVAVVSGSATSSIVTVSPIPATNNIHLTTSDVSLSGTTAIIYNTQGTMVYHTTLASDQNIDVSSWAPGMYSLHLANGTVIRIVKQ